MTHRTWLALFLTAGLFSLARAQEPPAPAAVVDKLMAPFAGDDRPGGVVAVVQRGQVTFARAYGMADLTHGVPIAPTTRFNIGSVSKQFAGLFFAMMAEEGRLSLDDDVRRYAPELPAFGPKVTLRHLLNHTSGYREVYGVLGLQGRRVDGDRLERADALDVVRRQTALQFPPGSRHLYNSTAYVILTTVAERITGMPYPDWMDAHVFGPLGMAQTSIEREPGEVMPGAAFSYTTTARGGYREDFEAYAYYGATDVYTNVYDLARWMHNLGASTLGGPGVMPRLQERSLLPSGDTLGYALGIVVDRHLGLKRLQHSGATGGYRALLAYYPVLDAGVVVLANTGAVPVRSVAEATAAAFFAAHARPEPAAAPLPPGVAVAPAHLDAYAGLYRLDGRGVFALVRTPDGLAWQAPGGSPRPLTARDEATFTLDAERTLHLGGDAPRMHVRGEGVLALQRVAPAPATPALEAYAGRYFSEELEAFYTLAVADDRLTLAHRRLGTLTLRPLAADLFAGPHPVREVAFERDASGRITGFRVTEGRTMAVPFRRLTE